MDGAAGRATCGGRTRGHGMWVGRGRGGGGAETSFLPHTQQASSLQRERWSTTLLTQLCYCYSDTPQNHAPQRHRTCARPDDHAIHVGLHHSPPHTRDPPTNPRGSRWARRRRRLPRRPSEVGGPGQFSACPPPATRPIGSERWPTPNDGVERLPRPTRPSSPPTISSRFRRHRQCRRPPPSMRRSMRWHPWRPRPPALRERSS